MNECGIIGHKTNEELQMKNLKPRITYNDAFWSYIAKLIFIGCILGKYKNL